MHIYFSGIGGAGIGPLAQIAHQTGYEVSGSDQQDSQYIHYLKKKGIKNIQVGQSYGEIAAVNELKPIDWLVHSSSIPDDSPELKFCREQGIRISKRDEFLLDVLAEKNLHLVAIAGTHGKTTTTAMVIWLMKKLSIPVSYSVGAKLPFGDMGHYEPASTYFVYEADEFDRNFLAYESLITAITGVSWDHHEIYPTREDYKAAFREFIEQSHDTHIWKEDADYLELRNLEPDNWLIILDSGDRHIDKIKLKGKYNRLDAWLAIRVVNSISGKQTKKLIEIINHFPGLSRRMEEIIPNLYSDYAHTPEKIRGAMSVATEMAAASGQKLIVVYEPLTNRRQHYMKAEYNNCFEGANKLYWLPSYLAREDSTQRIIPPEELINMLSNPEIAEPLKHDNKLKEIIQNHLNKGDMVVAMAGGGGNSLDDWLRQEF